MSKKGKKLAAASALAAVLGEMFYEAKRKKTDRISLQIMVTAIPSVANMRKTARAFTTATATMRHLPVRKNRKASMTSMPIS